jgi:hypothetical protein
MWLFMFVGYLWEVAPDGSFCLLICRDPIAVQMKRSVEISPNLLTCILVVLMVRPEGRKRRCRIQAHADDRQRPSDIQRVVFQRQLGARND